MFSHFLVLYKRQGVNGARCTQAGFGLVELLVSISVMIIVVGIVLVQQNAFNSALLLRGQAYEIALHAREVQLSAVSASGDLDTDFRSVMGLYFSTADGDNDHYHVFKDTGDGFYAAAEEWGPTGQLDPRFTVHKIRLDGVEVTDISVVFERPNFDAHFVTAPGILADAAVLEIDIVRVGTDGSSLEERRTIEITRTGQIAVKND